MNSCLSGAVRALLLVLPMAASAQQPATAPDWNLSGPAATTASPSTIPMQRQRRTAPVPMQPREAMPLPAPAAAATSQFAGEASGTRIPDGYRPMPAPAPVGSRADDQQRSHLGEDQLPEARQIALLRKRVAELTRQMDDVMARLVASEQALASHRHSYRVPNMGMISVETYNNYLQRQERNGQPIPFFSGSSDSYNTTVPVIPQ